MTDDHDRAFRIREARRERHAALFQALKDGAQITPHLKISPSGRDQYYRDSYNITSSRYEEMWEAQEGRCKICGEYKELDGKGADRLHVDHSHSSDGTRDLLCTCCNPMIGFARESPEILRAAANYLERHTDIAATL